MARFYLDLNECGLVTSDEEGIDLSDIAAVRIRAVKAARDIMCAEIAEGRLCLECRVEVRDALGLVMTVWFRDAVTVVGLRDSAG